MQVPQMGPKVQTWPISLGSEMQSSTSGQFSFGGSGLSTTGSVRPHDFCSKGR